eukprot:135915-Pyramimonas_sp.AAC.1
MPQHREGRFALALEPESAKRHRHPFIHPPLTGIWEVLRTRRPASVVTGALAMDAWRPSRGI